MFLEGTKEVKGVHDNGPPSNQVEHVVVDEVLDDDKFVKDVSPLILYL
jgi:hypothetical protein